MNEQPSENRRQPLLWLGLALAALAVVAAIVARRWRRRPVEGPVLAEYSHPFEKRDPPARSVVES
jgi:hypothetical protein